MLGSVVYLWQRIHLHPQFPCLLFFPTSCLLLPPFLTPSISCHRWPKQQWHAQKGFSLLLVFWQWALLEQTLWQSAQQAVTFHLNFFKKNRFAKNKNYANISAVLHIQCESVQSNNDSYEPRRWSTVRGCLMHAAHLPRNCKNSIAFKVHRVTHCVPCIMEYETKWKSSWMWFDLIHLDLSKLIIELNCTWNFTVL